MLNSFSYNLSDSSQLTDDEVVKLIRQQLPRWLAACKHADADTVIFSQMAFGRAQEEVFLMCIAVRYAGIVGKTVTIVPYPESQKLNS